MHVFPRALRYLLTNEMSPDVASFCVNLEDGFEALCDRVELWSVVLMQKFIVSKERRQGVVGK